MFEEMGGFEATGKNIFEGPGTARLGAKRDFEVWTYDLDLGLLL